MTTWHRSRGRATAGCPEPPHLVAGRSHGARRVAAALLAAGAAGQAPRVGGTAVTGLPHHVGEAPALSCGRLALAVLRVFAVLPDSAQVVADALCGKERGASMLACPLVTKLPIAFSLFSESPEVWADTGMSQSPWPGLADSTLNDTQHCTGALLMSQAGLLYGFCPSTEKAVGAPHSSSPVFLLLFFPSPVHNQSPSLPGSSQLAMVMDLLERPIACPAQQSSARLPSDPLPCQAVSSTEGKEGLPAHHLGRLTGQDSVPLPGHIWRNAGVNKTQTLTHPATGHLWRRGETKTANKRARDPPPTKASSFQHM